MSRGGGESPDSDYIRGMRESALEEQEPMTVAQLISRLSSLPPDASVVLAVHEQSGEPSLVVVDDASDLDDSGQWVDAESLEFVTDLTSN